MTVAKTLPSCVAFEYKDGNPYCFYAYDTDQKLYRVLWTDFSNLNEGDMITVDHNGEIKEFTYQNPPGGWTPRYEITAIEVNRTSEFQTLKSDTSGVIKFYAEATAESTDPISFILIHLSNEEENQIKTIIENINYWTDDNIVDREGFFFDGEIKFSGTDHIYYFSYDSLIIYYDHFFAEISEQDMRHIQEISEQCKNSDLPYQSVKGDCLRLYDWFSPHCSEVNPEFEIVLASFPDTTIKIVDGTVYANDQKLIGGAAFGCQSFYTSDLNKDGYPELAFGMGLGSGIVDMRVVILDLTTGKQLFELEGRHEWLDYLLFVRDGELCVREIPALSFVHKDDQEVLRTGTIICKDNVFEVIWDETVDYREDDQLDKIEHPIP